jgi:hypothetical protein
MNLLQLAAFCGSIKTLEAYEEDAEQKLKARYDAAMDDCPPHHDDLLLGSPSAALETPAGTFASSPLHLACAANQVEAVRHLARRVCQLATPEGAVECWRQMLEGALLAGLRAGSKEAVEELLRMGWPRPRPGQKHSFDLDTVVWLAMQRSHSKQDREQLVRWRIAAFRIAYIAYRGCR